MTNILNTNNVKVFFNDKRVHNCTNISITADLSDQLFHCVFSCLEAGTVYSGSGYLERLIDDGLYLRIQDGNDDESKDYFKGLYL